MKIIHFLKKEFEGFNKKEIILFSFVIIFISALSFILNDNKIALVSAICGICYTVLAGKGKVLCYFTGITGTVCYCILAYKNGIWGNLLLWSLYYFPMEIIGIFKWLKHYKKNKNEIEKTKLKPKNSIKLFVIFFTASLIFGFILNMGGEKTPYIDSFTTIFSILGQLLTVKRCIEQWFVWFIVNILSLYMWIIAYLNGSNCLATVLMWLIYIFLAIYFYTEWKKETLE